MKKYFTLLLAFVLAFSLAACGNNSTSSDNESTEITIDDSTMGNKLAGMFLNKIGQGDTQALAEELAEASGLDCVVIEAQEGYLNGFTEEVKGFKSAVQFAPMIGSIPFVGYIFETDDPDGLKLTLESTADPRWNICTEAAETVCVTSGNYVFFTMCPGEE